MNAEPLVMAADNEPDVLRHIERELTRRGFRVSAIGDARELVDAASTQRPDVVIVGLALARVPSTELIRRLRELTNAPIIALTRKGAAAARQRDEARQLGADALLEKPFTVDQLRACVRTALRSRPASWSGEHVVRAGHVEVDLRRRFAAKDGRIVPLTRTEWLLLSYLAEHAGHPSGDGDLLRHVWGAADEHERQNLRVWISRLRRKLEDEPSDPRLIVTVPHAGYMLAVA